MLVQGSGFHEASSVVDAQRQAALANETDDSNQTKLSKMAAASVDKQHLGNTITVQYRHFFLVKSAQ